MDYKSAGVDIQKGDAFVESIKTKVRTTYNDRVYNGVGGFAGLYKVTEDRLLACGVDGVGTKLMLAQELGIHHTIGQDLVAMCANDILCTGARPLFFTDYLATGTLDLHVSEAIIDGIISACTINEMALLGGETAEMPGMYETGKYDLAGFACGEMQKSDLIDGSQVRPGDTIIAIASSGFHSNGYSLIRKIIEDMNCSPTEKIELKKLALTPTKLYWPIMKEILESSSSRSAVTGMAHITGGGLNNINRINPKFRYDINELPNLDKINPVFSKILKDIDLSKDDLYSTFNMGIGFVITTPNPDTITNHLDNKNEEYFIIGKVS